MSAPMRVAGADRRLRVLVVGAGITGLLTAIRCVLAGHQVVVLERGSIPCPEATSFDQHRALRALVPGDRRGTQHAAGLHRLWREMDELLCDHLPGACLYRRTGVLTALAPQEVIAVTEAAAAAELPVRVIDPRAFSHIGFPSGLTAVLEPHAGTLLADRVLLAATRWLRRHPLAELRPSRTVVDVHPGEARVWLHEGGSESGDVVLVAAGPWSAELVGLPVTLHRQTMVYLRPPDELAHVWAGTPIAGGLGVDGRAWLLPSVAGTLLKISSEEARREVRSLSTPDDGPDWAARLLAAGIVSDPDAYSVVRVRDCHYATAADGGTGYVRVGPAGWARPASGGAGFRTAPLVAADMAARLAGLAAGVAA
jgi:glycine/D-amino acid oxidase-like deaminating enzyme